MVREGEARHSDLSVLPHLLTNYLSIMERKFPQTRLGLDVVALIAEVAKFEEQWSSNVGVTGWSSTGTQLLKRFAGDEPHGAGRHLQFFKLMRLEQERQAEKQRERRLLVDVLAREGGTTIFYFGNKDEERRRVESLLSDDGVLEADTMPEMIDL